jgi:hypothetical protein
MMSGLDRIASLVVLLREFLILPTKSPVNIPLGHLVDLAVRVYSVGTDTRVTSYFQRLIKGKRKCKQARCLHSVFGVVNFVHNDSYITLNHHQNVRPVRSELMLVLEVLFSRISSQS